MGKNQSVRNALVCGAAAVLTTGLVVGAGLALHGAHDQASARSVALADTTVASTVERVPELSRSFDRGATVEDSASPSADPTTSLPGGNELRFGQFATPAVARRLHHLAVVRRAHVRAAASASASAEAVREAEAEAAASSAAAQSAPAAPVSVTAALEEIAQCESHGNWSDDTGNGYYGGLQFSLGTWQGYGGTGLPSDASKAEQIAIAAKLVAADGGYGAWPACSAEYGLPQ
jgi:hypothetical protein